MTTFQNVWPVNELGEIVAAAGVGSSSVTGFVNQDQIPVGSSGKVKIAGMAQLATDAGGNVVSVSDPVGSIVASYAGPVALPSRSAALIAAPITIVGGKAVVGKKPAAYVPIDPRTEVTQYYVDIVNGSDANNGSTWALAFKSIWKATTAGNTAAVPFTVNIAAGRYSRANNFANASATVIPTQSCVFRAVGGRVECHTGGALTWTLNNGTTYQVTRSNVSRVIDWLNVDSDGDYVELAKAVSLAECQAVAGTWYTNGTTTYVNRTDGAAVTDANTSALLTAVEGIEFTTSGNMHLYGIYQIGGTNGAVRLRNNVNGRFYAEDCGFSFSTGPSGSPVDNVTSLDCGLVVMNRCVSSKGQKDGFNYHSNAGSIPQAIHFDCMGFGNGVVTTSTSNNGATTHDAGLLVDFNGRYYKNAGGDFAHAGTGTLAVGVCTKTYGSTGDVDRGGVVPAGTGFHSVTGADIYKYLCHGSNLITGAGEITSAL